MRDVIRLRRDTAANWAAANPILEDGEPGFDKTNRLLKIGDDVTPWNELEVFVESPMVFVDNGDGTVTLIGGNVTDNGDGTVTLTQGVIALVNDDGTITLITI
jgi:hypothetical protein